MPGGIPKKKIRKLIGLNGKEANTTIVNTISEIFNEENALYFLLMGVKNQDTEYVSKPVENALSSEMSEFKHILHPFRLTIMKILYEEECVASKDIKLRIDLTWAEYYNTINALQKYGLLRIYDDFDAEGFKTQFVRIEGEGRKQYVKAIETIDKFVQMAKESIYSKDYALYPPSDP